MQKENRTDLEYLVEKAWYRSEILWGFKQLLPGFNVSAFQMVFT